MASLKQVQELAELWGQVIQYLYPDIETIVKGDPFTVDSLLSGWEASEVVYPVPKEADLLLALAVVKAGNAEAEIVKQSIIDEANVSVGKTPVELKIDEEAKGDLLMALLLALGAFDVEGNLKAAEHWLVNS